MQPNTCEHTFDKRGDGKTGTCLNCGKNIQPTPFAPDAPVAKGAKRG